MKKLLTSISNNLLTIMFGILFLMFIAIIALIVIGSNFGRGEIYSVILTILLGLLLWLAFDFLMNANKPSDEISDEKK